MENLPTKQPTQSNQLTVSHLKEVGYKLTISETDIVIALNGAKIKDLSERDFGLFMDGLIHKTHVNCGFKVDSNAIDITIDELCIDLKKYNGNLTANEIELAFKNGYKKEYGDFFGLNNATYFFWVNAYTYGEKRLKVKKMLLEAKENTNKEPEKKSPEEIEYILKGAVLRSFDDFRKGAIIFDAGNVKYNYLAEKGLINLTKERKDEIFILTEKRLKSEAIESKQKTESIEKALSKILPNTIISESKKEALNIYFKELVEMEMELLDELEKC